MLKQTVSTRRLCRAGLIAGLYTALTYAFLPFAFGPFQIRPAEALCLLPLFFPESVVALFIGCALANIASPMLYDLVFGSLTTLVAGVCTFFVGKLLKTDTAKIAVGGIFPVLLNAIVIPFMLVFFYDGGVGANGFFVAYIPYFLSILLTQAVWVYALGAPMYFSVQRLQKRGVKFFT